MIYVGMPLRAPFGQVDPALIDPTLPVAATGDFTQRLTSYYPSYSEILPQARRA